MKILQLVQGSPQWVAARASYNCASEAAAMMGVSKHMTRTELLALKSFGGERIANYFLEQLFAKGHATEARAREILAERLGEDLYPVTATDDDDYLLGSSDGSTIDDLTGFEHKLWNEELAACVRAGELPPSHYWQLEQLIAIFGFKRIIFVCSDGTPDRWVEMEYRAVPGRRKALMAGWRQFDADVLDYKPAPVVVPVIGRALDPLPTLSVSLVGEVKSSNLAVYKERALSVIEAINTDLNTDQDFADAEKAVKFCEDVEATCVRVKADALAGTVSIDEFTKAVDALRDASRAKRLLVAKLITARKEAIRFEIAEESTAVMRTHVAALAKRVGRSVPFPDLDLAAAMKGKKTVAGLREACSTAVAHAKIAANETADLIDLNQQTLKRIVPAELLTLFPDYVQLTLKAEDDFLAAVTSRVAAHTAAQAERDERIRNEERAKAAEAPPAPAPVAPVPPAAGAVVSAPLAAYGRMRSELLATPPAAPLTSDTAILDWIEDNATIKKVRGALVLTLPLPNAIEDLRKSIVAALAEGAHA